MQASKRWFLHAALAGAITLLPGCATYALHQDKVYSENLKSMLITQDGVSIAILGSDYHYVFTTPKGLAPVLNSPIKDQVYASFGEFTVQHDNTVTGSFSLYLTKEHRPEAQDIAEGLGFSRNNHSMSFQLTGKRYAAKDNLALSSNYRLNREYSVRMVDKGSYAKEAVKIAATPVAVAADGVVILGLIVLSPIWITLKPDFR